MSNDIDSRVTSILQNKAAAEAEKAQRELLSKEQKETLAKLEAGAPALWAERWELFQDCARVLNEKLAPANIRVGVSPLPKIIGEHELAHFQISIDVDGVRSDYFMDCTVKRQGDIGVSRTLPGLVVAMFIRHNTIDANAINKLFLDFVENAQGFRTTSDMMNDRFGI
jgi:hypothetical protein